MRYFHDYAKIEAQLLQNYLLDLHGIHGISHWLRVNKIGLAIAEQEGADQQVVTLFSLLHDSCRQNDGCDPDHGQRAAAAATLFLHDYRLINAVQLTLLLEACQSHTEGHRHDNSTIGCCWDADRLDLYRLGMDVDPQYLSTATAKTRRMHDLAISLWQADKLNLKKQASNSLQGSAKG